MVGLEAGQEVRMGIEDQGVVVEQEVRMGRKNGGHGGMTGWGWRMMGVEAGQEVKIGIGRKTESKGERVLIEAESGTASEGGGNG